jgi:hypothetical protein
MRTLPLACLALCVVACRPPRDDTPEAAYRAFAAAANKGDATEAFSRLTSESRQAVTREVSGLSSASGGSLREDPGALVFSAGRGQPITSVRLLKKDPDRATVEVTAGGQTREVTLLREGTEWRVELPRKEPARAP